MMWHRGGVLLCAALCCVLRAATGEPHSVGSSLLCLSSLQLCPSLSFSVALPACLAVCLPARPPACLPACLPACPCIISGFTEQVDAYLDGAVTPCWRHRKLPKAQARHTQRVATHLCMQT